MRADAQEDVWLGFGNQVEWVVFDSCNDSVSDLAALTRVVFKAGSITVDSNIESSIVSWTDSVTGKLLPDGSSYTGNVIRMKLGLATGMAVGEYEGCCLILYDPTYPNGLVVSDNIALTVYNTCT